MNDYLCDPSEKRRIDRRFWADDEDDEDGALDWTTEPTPTVTPKP